MKRMRPCRCKSCCSSSCSCDGASSTSAASVDPASYKTTSQGRLDRNSAWLCRLPKKPFSSTPCSSLYAEQQQQQRQHENQHENKNHVSMQEITTTTSSIRSHKKRSSESQFLPLGQQGPLVFGSAPSNSSSSSTRKRSRRRSTFDLSTSTITVVQRQVRTETLISILSAVFLSITVLVLHRPELSCCSQKQQQQHGNGMFLVQASFLPHHPTPSARAYRHASPHQRSRTAVGFVPFPSSSFAHAQQSPPQEEEEPPCLCCPPPRYGPRNGRAPRFFSNLWSSKQSEEPQAQAVLQISNPETDSAQPPHSPLPATATADTVKPTPTPKHPPTETSFSKGLFERYSEHCDLEFKLYSQRCVLESMTVRELRQRVKEHIQKSNRKDIRLSSFKRKQEYIDYLMAFDSAATITTTITLALSATEKPPQPTKTSLSLEGRGAAAAKQDHASPTTTTTTTPLLVVMNDSIVADNPSNTTTTTTTTTSNGNEEPQQQQPLLRKPPRVKRPLSMAPLPPQQEEEQEQPLEDSKEEQPQQSQEQVKQPQQSQHQSPKDWIFEQIYRQYPPLREEALAASALLHQQQQQQQQDDTDSDESEDMSKNNNDNNVDLRSIYHPIFQSQDLKNVISADMDIVFVGTASCVPGITRGVSCTALRLNWCRNNNWRHKVPQEHHPTTTKTTPSRGTSKANANSASSANSISAGTWLFDVGECTQLNIQKTASIRPSKITKIFLTHAHGDHSFGLPGLLCLLGQDKERFANKDPIDIYGPEGIRMWLRVAIRYSVSRIVPPYRVHELCEVPMAPEWEFNPRARRYFYKGMNRVGQSSSSTQQSSASGGNKGDSVYARPWGSRGMAGEDPLNWISQANMMPLEASSMYGEVGGGRNLYPIYNHKLSADGAPVWELEMDDSVRVYAAPMSHSIPCVGYVVDEQARPGRLRSEVVEPLVRRNADALRKAGFVAPMKAMAVIKNLQPGSSFTFPDGTVLTQEEAVEPPRQGRKVVICGDTASSRALYNLAQNADVVVHEATNTYLQGVDKKDKEFGGSSTTNGHAEMLAAVTRDTVLHGHSTPALAGSFAKAVRAKRLILNHFSPRYKGDVSVESLSIMMRIERQASAAAGMNETQVAAAWDMMLLPLPVP